MARQAQPNFDKILRAQGGASTPGKPRQSKADSSVKIAYRLSATDKQRTAVRYQEGWSSRRIAQEFGVSKNSIVILLRQAGIPIRNQGLNEQQAQEAVRRYQAGESLASIGNFFDVSSMTVRNALTSADVRIRNPWDR